MNAAPLAPATPQQVPALQLHPSPPATPRRAKPYIIMSPHRSLSADAALPAATAAAGMLSTLTSIVTGVHAWVFAALLGVMILDLVTATDRARWNGDETYDPEKAHTGWKGKGKRLALVALGFLFDTVLIALSKHSGIGDGVFEMGWTMAGAMGWLFRVESLSVLDNVRRTEGRRVIFPGFTVADGALRTAVERGSPAPPEGKTPSP